MPVPEGRRFVVTTVVRGAPLGAVTGHIHVVDAEARRLLARWPIPETPWAAYGTNPRGGHRGGRGIATHDGRLAIANADEVHLYDRSWRHHATLSHPLAGDIHEVALVAGGIWLCSSRSDSLVRLDWEGALQERWSWRDEPALVGRLGYRQVAPIDTALDFRRLSAIDVDRVDLSHVNGVALHGDALLVSLGRVRLPSPSATQRALAAVGSAAHALRVGRPVTNRLRAERVRCSGADPVPGADRRGLIVELRPDHPPAVLVERPLAHWPNHNVVEHEGRIVLCDTSRGLLVAAGRRPEATTAVEVGGAARFLRGLAHLDGQRFIVGTRRPAAILLADLESGGSESLLALSDDVDESVHDVAPLPPDWDDPPVSLGGA